MDSVMGSDLKKHNLGSTSGSDTVYDPANGNWFDSQESESGSKTPYPWITEHKDVFPDGEPSDSMSSSWSPGHSGQDAYGWDEQPVGGGGGGGGGGVAASPYAVPSAAYRDERQVNSRRFCGLLGVCRRLLRR